MFFVLCILYNASIGILCSKTLPWSLWQCSLGPCRPWRTTRAGFRWRAWLCLAISRYFKVKVSWWTQFFLPVATEWLLHCSFTCNESVHFLEDCWDWQPKESHKQDGYPQGPVPVGPSTRSLLGSSSFPRYTTHATRATLILSKFSFVRPRNAWFRSRFNESHYLGAVCWDKKSDWYTTRFFFDLGWFKTLASSASIQQVWSKQFVVQTVQTVCTPGTVLKHDQTKLRHSGFGSGGPLEPKRQTDRLLVELSILHGKNHVASLLTFDCSGASARCCLDWRKLWSCKMNCWQIYSV